MNEYITLDGKKYKAVHPDWTPRVSRPVVVKRLLSGGRNITFGPSVAKQWQGMITVGETADGAGYGTRSDLETTIDKLQTLSFTDHLGNVHTVVIDTQVDERSKTPKWDAASNRWLVTIALVEV